MNKKITVINIPNEIKELVNKYSEQLAIECEKVINITADKIINYIQTSAPRSLKSNKHLADQFTKEVKGTGLNTKITIFASHKGSLIHLIEFGFFHIGGSFITARPFMRPAFDKYIEEMVAEIITLIQTV